MWDWLSFKDYFITKCEYDFGFKFSFIDSKYDLGFFLWLTKISELNIVKVITQKQSKCVLHFQSSAS